MDDDDFDAILADFGSTAVVYYICTVYTYVTELRC